MEAHVSRSIAWILYFAIFISFLIGIATSYRDYKYYRSHREELKASNVLFVDRNCLDLVIMSKMGVQGECHKRRHLLEEDPAEYAIYDILKSWSLCGEQGCIGSTPNTDIVGVFTIRSVLELSVAVIFLVFILLLSGGLCLCKQFVQGWSRTLLPIHAKVKSI